ncbi:MAG: ABC transporter ATP-binding protein/permease [Lachnospiraceae bacterium]|nr:ABC transporter ATP-binding protein/permease [Lachnospiraceae bacterium]
MNQINSKQKLSGLFSYAGPYKVLTITGCILSGISSVLSLIPYLCLYRIIRGLFQTYPHYYDAKNIIFYGWLSVAFAAGSLILYFIGLLCTHFAAFRISKNMKKVAISHIVTLPLGYFSNRSSGQLRKIINDNADMTETFLAHQLPDTVGALVLPVAILIMLFSFDARLGVLCLLPMMIGVAFLSCMFVGKNSGFMKTYMDALEEMNGQAVEYIRGMPVVKVFGQSIYSFKNFYNSILKYKEFACNYALNCRIPMVGFTIAINGAPFFLIPFAILLLGKTGNSVAFFLDFLFYALFSPVCASMMTRIMYAAETSMQAQSALDRLQEVLNENPLLQPENPKKPQDASIDFEDVTFTYPGAKEPALNHVSFHVSPGQTIALVGASGGGKTTAASLIPRFFDPQKGAVKIGGINVKEISEKDLMTQVAFVFQDTHLFKESVLDNLKIAKPTASREQVETAIHTARCDDIIEKLPLGLDTVIGEKGVYLSGGEKQRLALARAILKDAPIVILDEATAFADSENEAAIQKAFEGLTQNKTVIMIAHRLSTVQNANCIFVLEDGQIKEQGTHTQLLEQHGIYTTMWQDYQSSVSWKIKKEA